MKRTQILELLKAQATLNDNYVKNWRNELELEHIKSAFICEFAEFLESTPRFGIITKNFTGWKWWKTYLTDDIQNSKVEIIDILHFGLSYHMLMNYKKSGLYGNIDDFDLIGIIRDYNRKLDISVSKNNLLRLVYGALEVFFIDGDLDQLFYMLEVMASYHNMSLDEVYKGYFLKNELNLKRIQNGYLDGTYKKVDENGNEDNRDLNI